MNSTDQQRADEQRCVVCGKDMADARPAATFFIEGRPLPVCCPLCLRAYQDAPARFQHRAEAHQALLEAERLLGLKPRE